VTYWLIVIIYVIGSALSTVPLIEQDMDDRITRLERTRDRARAEYPNTWRKQGYEDGPYTLTMHGRRLSVYAGMGKALIWWLTLPAFLMARRITPPLERRRAEQAELRRLRELAKENSLEFPGDE
jgi:hypothetical protein